MTSQLELFNFQFSSKLDNWTPLSASLRCHFSDHEIELLERSDRMFQKNNRTIVILSFENSYAPLGGLAAVLRHFPQSLVKQGERVVILTPLHTGCSKVMEAIKNKKLIERFSGSQVRVCGFTGNVSCFEETDAAVTTFHIGIEGRFCAGDNPYGYADQQDLIFDALSFCAVVPSVLSKLSMFENLIFHGNDWETASIALFARYAVLSGILQSVKTILTLHNSFDAPLTDHFKKMFFNKPLVEHTVLQAMLPLINGPLTTVSTPFAHELRNDPLQCGVFADHLQTFFNRNPPVGIENGMFGKPDIPFTKKEIASAQAGDASLLLAKKLSWRKTFINLLRNEHDSRIIGQLSCMSLDNPSVPILFMSGRLDLMQKGFDVVFHAMKLQKRGTVQLFFCPTLHSENDDLSFFREIADACPGDITIWPFRLSSEFYRNCLLGSSFLVMPSLYEPFGSASEGLLHGTPLIARATGGLLAQIHPDSNFVIPSTYVDLFASAGLQPANGILFKEDYPDEEAKSIWRKLLQTTPQQRMEFKLYQSIVHAASEAFGKAVTIFTHPHLYGALILEGLHSVQGFTWDAAAKKYQSVYDVAQTRG